MPSVLWVIKNIQKYHDFLIKIYTTICKWTKDQSVLSRSKYQEYLEIDIPTALHIWGWIRKLDLSYDTNWVQRRSIAIKKQLKIDVLPRQHNISYEGICLTLTSEHPEIHPIPSVRPSVRLSTYRFGVVNRLRQTIWDYPRPSKMILDHLRPSDTIWDHSRSTKTKGSHRSKKVCGHFPNITEAILNDENSTKSLNLPDNLVREVAPK